ncbi:MAG: hybrid sensor histidine kinase/response regulator, partial [Longimicrobiales bacterium]
MARQPPEPQEETPADRVPLDRLLLDHILDDSLNEIFVFDHASLRFIQVNQGARRNLGYTMDELRSMTPLSIKPDLTMEEFERHIRPLRTGEKEQVVFHTHHGRKDGTRYPVEVHLQLARHGPTPRFVAIILDLTDRIHLQNQFLHAQKMESVGRLTGGLAHDLNNLLAGVLTGCRLVARRLEKGDIQGALAIASEVEDSIESGTAMTRRLLDFSRTEQSTVFPIEAGAVFDTAEPMLRRLLGADIEVVIAQSARGQFLADRGRIEQVVMNLCINARDAMSDGGTITIETRDVEVPGDQVARQPAEPGPYVQFTVSDTGCGMSPEVRARAVEPYFTTKDAGEGTGLGLSTVFQIVSETGGFMEIDSQPGVGSAFRLYFPRCEDSEERQQASTVSPAKAGTGETVLLVEDEALLRAAMKELLVELGYKPLTAADSDLAIELSEKHRGSIDLVMTDVVLPSMGGVD